MSTGRETAVARAKDAIDEYERWVAEPLKASATHTSLAASVVNAVLPEITESKQFSGVPNGSILIVRVFGGVVPVEWDAPSQKLLRRPGHPFLNTGNPSDAIATYGPLTVVWMP